MSFWSRIANAVHGERLNREIEEELQLLVNVDYRLAEEPSVRLKEAKPSKRTGELTYYEFEGFIVELLATRASCPS